MGSMKRVRLALSVDEHFIRLLNGQVGLSGGFDGPDRQMTPGEQLARVVLLEARGAPEAQVHRYIRPEWRPHIEAVGDLREVELADEEEGGGDDGG